MKHLYTLFTFLLLLTVNGWGQVTLTGWEMNGLTTYGASPFAPTTTASNLTFGGLTRGDGITTTGSAASNAWGGNGLTGTDLSSAVAGNDFVTFTIKANSGFKQSLSEISAYNIRRSGTGPTTGQWQYSTNGSDFTNIGSAITWGSTTSSFGNAQSAIDLSGISALQNVNDETTVTFRIVLWGGTSMGGTWYINNFQTGDDLMLKGTVETATVAANTSLTGAAGWRLLASPVSGATYADLLDPIWTQGATGADVSNGTPNVYTHLSGDSTYTAVTDLTASLPGGRGIAVYVYADDNYDEAGGDSWPKTLSVTGTENADGTTFTPASWTSGDEYAIAGNPFASTIDWDVVEAASGADVGASVWVWNPDSSAYDAWNGSSGDLTDGLIAPFQGFWMQYSGADRTLTFNAGAKTTGGSFRGKSADEAPFVLALRGSSGEKRHSAWLEFSETGLMGRDPNDAVSFVPMATEFVHVGSIAEGVKYDINHLPLLEERTEIPVALTATMGGEVTLSLPAFNLPEGWSATLRDAETDITHTLTADWTATVQTGLAKEASVDPLSFDGRPVVQAADAVTRFTLIIDPGTSTSTPDAGRSTPDAIALHGAYPNPFNPTTAIRFTLDAGRQTRLAVYDVLGRQVAVLVDGPMPAGEHKATFDASTLTSGVYIVRLEAGGMSMTRRVTLLK